MYCDPMSRIAICWCQSYNYCFMKCQYGHTTDLWPRNPRFLRQLETVHFGLDTLKMSHSEHNFGYVILILMLLYENCCFLFQIHWYFSQCLSQQNGSISSAHGLVPKMHMLRACGTRQIANNSFLHGCKSRWPSVFVEHTHAWWHFMEVLCITISDILCKIQWNLYLHVWIAA